MLYAAVKPPEQMTLMSSLCAHESRGNAVVSAPARKARRESLSMMSSLALPTPQSYSPPGIAASEAYFEAEWDGKQFTFGDRVR
jgi:hypothetical protein